LTLRAARGRIDRGFEEARLPEQRVRLLFRRAHRRVGEHRQCLRLHPHPRDDRLCIHPLAEVGAAALEPPAECERHEAFEQARFVPAPGRE
jgi:non-ribosomal peptide synthetase component F